MTTTSDLMNKYQYDRAAYLQACYMAGISQLEAERDYDEVMHMLAFGGADKIGGAVWRKWAVLIVAVLAVLLVLYGIVYFGWIVPLRLVNMGINHESCVQVIVEWCK